MEKHEMTAREFLRDFARMCKAHPMCEGCTLDKYRSCDLLNPTVWEYVFDATAKWAAEHPEPKKTILVPDEAVRITTIEMTQVVFKEFIEVLGNREFTKDEIEKYKNDLRELFNCRFDPDDLHIKVQQFVTKSHEEEV